MSGHTPGPWRCEHHRGAYAVRYGEEGNNAIACSLHYSIAVKADAMRARSDARLIASAPTMREAVVAWMAYHDALESCADIPSNMASFCTVEGDTLDSLWETATERARAALKLADGGGE